MRKALSLLGLAHIAKKTQGLFGMEENLSFNANGNELQIRAINTMQMALDHYGDMQFTPEFVVETSKNCEEINAKLREIGSGLQLTDQKRDDVAYGMSKETTEAPFDDAVLVKFPHPLGREVEAMMTKGTIFTSEEGAITIIIEQANGIQFIIRPKKYVDVTIEDLIDPRWINEKSSQIPIVRDIVIPKIAGGKAEEIDLSWLADSYTQENIKFVEVRGEATFSIEEEGVSYTQTTAASMSFECMSSYADIPKDAYILDGDFVITAMYDNSVPLFTFAVESKPEIYTWS